MLWSTAASGQCSSFLHPGDLWFSVFFQGVQNGNFGQKCIKYYGNLENIEIKGTLVQNILVGLIFRNNPPDVFLKYAANLQENTLVSLLHNFRTNFPKNTSGGLLLDIDCQ